MDHSADTAGPAVNTSASLNGPCVTPTPYELT